MSLSVLSGTQKKRTRTKNRTKRTKIGQNGHRIGHDVQTEKERTKRT